MGVDTPQSEESPKVQGGDVWQVVVEVLQGVFFIVWILCGALLLPVIVFGSGFTGAADREIFGSLKAGFYVSTALLVATYVPWKRIMKRVRGVQGEAGESSAQTLRVMR